MQERGVKESEGRVERGSRCGRKRIVGSWGGFADDVASVVAGRSGEDEAPSIAEEEESSVGAGARPRALKARLRVMSVLVSGTPSIVVVVVIVVATAGCPLGILTSPSLSCARG